MARPTRGARLGSGPAHEKAILRGLSRSLILHGRVVTTEVKAKKARPYVEKLITKARKGGLHNRRLVLSDLQDKKAVHRLFSDVAPKTGDRPGGYTRILKLGPRRGDASPMAILELVDAPRSAPVAELEEPKRRRGLRARRERRREQRRRERAGHVHDHDHDHEHDHVDDEVSDAELEAEALAATAEDEPAEQPEQPEEEKA
jgi:large subunit ribosomal protein L17